MPVEAPETRTVETKTIACDGGGDALGHPRVYLNMGDEGQVECPYCDALFILKGGSSDKKAASD